MSKLIKNISSLGLVQFANNMLPLIYVPIISRIIGPEKYGIINFSASFVTYFTLIISYGFDLSATRRIAANPEDKVLRNEVFNEVFNAKILLFFISAIFFIISLSFVPEFQSEKKVAIFSFLTCIATLFTQNWMFQAMQDIGKMAILNFLSRLLLASSILLLIRQESDYPMLSLITSSVNIIISLLCFVWALKRYELRIHSFPIKYLFSILYKERIIFFSTIMVTLYSATNIVLLGLVKTPLDVGYYTSGQRLIMIVHMMITAPITLTLYPYVGKQFNSSYENGILVLQKIFPLIFCLLTGIGFMIFLIAPLLVNFFYGDRYLPTVMVLKLVAFVPLFMAINNFFGMYVMLNLKMDRIYFKVTLIGAIIGIICNIVLVQIFGYIGAAINWVTTEFLISGMLYGVLRLKRIDVVKFEKFTPTSMIQTLKSIKK